MSSQRRAGPLRRTALSAASPALCLCALARPGFAEPSELPPEIGDDYGAAETPRTAAMGGATRAFGSSTDALFANPANMAATRVYHLGALLQLWPEAARQAYGAAAVDSIVSSTRLAGGIGGFYSVQDPAGIERTFADLRFALALPVADRLFLGLGGRHLWLKEDGDGPLGPSVISAGLAGKHVVRRFSFDAGATLMPVRELAISIVGYNLSVPGDSYQPTMLGGGVGYGSRVLTLEGDVVGDFTTWERPTVRAMGGGELLAGDHFPLRLGYRFDHGADSHAVTGGVGYIDRRFSVELGVRRTVAGDPATAIFFGLKYHLDATEFAPRPGDEF